MVTTSQGGAAAKQGKIQKTVLRMKTKSSAKGDPKLDKDKRFAIFVEFSEQVRAELTPTNLQLLNS
jgi:hypothetical protein